MTDIIYEPSHTTHWKNLFASKNLLLGSHNLNPGEELVVKITDVAVSKIKNQQGQEEQVPVLTFENAPPMVLNITNARTMEMLHGPYYDHWKGKHIQIYATEVQAFGEIVQALRIREFHPTVDIDTTQYENDLRACTTLDDLKAVFMAIPKHIKPSLSSVKDEMKEALQ